MHTTNSPLSDFNPRSLTGATMVEYFTFSEIPFQSTLPRGSDQTLPAGEVMKPNFNPRSLAGATIHKSAHLLRLRHFNPRSLAGATIYYC